MASGSVSLTEREGVGQVSPQVVSGSFSAVPLASEKDSGSPGAG